jgi:hypothetical protein
MRVSLWQGVLLSAGLALTAGAHKVQTSDAAVEREIVAAGGRLIADYGGYELFETARTNGVVLRDNYNLVLLNAGPVDTSKAGIQALPEAGFTGKRLHLVQFAGPVQPAWRKALLETGAQIVDYVPHNAYLIYGSAATLGKVQALAATNPAIQWHGPYADAYKIRTTARAGADRFSIQLVADSEANAETLKLLGGRIQWQERVLRYLNIVARLPAGEAARMAGRPDVISIQPWSEPRKLCERQDQIVAGNLSGTVPAGAGYLAWLESIGFTQEQFDASGFAVDISDSGVDDGTTSPNHFGLYEGGNIAGTSRVIYSRLEGTPNSPSSLEGCDGHGTIDAHIVGGFDDSTNFPFTDGSGYHYGLGVCPFVRLGASVVFDPLNWTSPTFSVLTSQAYADGARISNNSWGYTQEQGVYDMFAQDYDALVRDAQPDTNGNQEMTIVFAAGDTNADLIVDSPATAKNVIAVGGAQNVQLFGGPDNCGIGDDQADNANEMASLSAHGPCSDGRHKPDLVAPATHVSGGVIQVADPGPLGTADPCYVSNFDNGEGICGGYESAFYPSSQQFYTASSGTSHSAPCVAGGCALLRQYFINRSSAPPSPAMTKAYLMNCARYLTGASAGGTLWSDVQGMGELDLGSAFDGTPRVLRDELGADLFTASGQTRTFTGVIVNTNIPFRVTVAWTDAPGSTAGAAYNNDLDLTVIAGGQTYLGNVFSGAWSVTGGAPDAMNNVESVFLPPGSAGNFIVTVTAANINSVGVPNSGNALEQDFALVIDNASGGPWDLTLENAQARGTNFIFSIQTESNQTYTVEYNNALANAAWTPIQTFFGDGSTQWITNGISSSQGYYRIRSP